MSENKRIIERYIDGYNRAGHDQVAECLTEDVEWVIPGLYHLVGKDAFREEAEKAVVGTLTITISRMVEEDNVVIAEGAVKADNGLSLVFCDVFEMQDTKIRKLTSYLTVLEPPKVTS